MASGLLAPLMWAVALFVIAVVIVGIIVGIRSLRRLGSGKGKRVVAFSSGGLTGMLVGCALDLEDDKTIDLMMQVRNCSYTSFLYSPGRCTLTSFNAVPHLYPDMWTVG